MKWPSFVARLTGCESIATNLLRARFTVAAPGEHDGTAGHGEYERLAAGDEAVALYFTGDEHAAATRIATNPGALGGWELVDDSGIESRNYTVRAYDESTREMVIDVAVHGHGPAIEWFRAARPGWEVLMAGPRSWYTPPTAADRHILAGDLAALPALARILDDTDPSIPVTVVAEVLDRSDLAYLPDRAGVEVIEVIGSGNGRGPTRLAAKVAELDLGADDYCWFACEAADVRAVKKHLRAQGWDRTRYDAVGYWRDNSEQWEARFAEHGDELLKVYQDALAAGRSAEEATDLFDAALEKAGL